jgi:hypothetical protein
VFEFAAATESFAFTMPCARRLVNNFRAQRQHLTGSLCVKNKFTGNFLEKLTVVAQNRGEREMRLN